MTDAPPGRYKVVERGRRLVVIDTQTGRPAAARRAPVDDRSGNAVLTTSRLYDLKGPRRIVIGEAVSNRLSRAIGGWAIAAIVFTILSIFFPLLLLLPVVLLFQPKVRAAFRNWATARLDEADQAAS